MTDNKKNQDRLKRAVKRLVRAKVELSWVGNYTDAEDRHRIKEEARKAEEYFSKVVSTLLPEGEK